MTNLWKDGRTQAGIKIGQPEVFGELKSIVKEIHPVGRSAKQYNCYSFRGTSDLRHRGTWSIDTVNGFKGLEEIRLEDWIQGVWARAMWMSLQK